MSASEPVQAIVAQTPSAVFNDAQPLTLDDGTLSSTLESVRAELMSLSLRQAEVQKRIQHVRHALLELVHVFGPEILVTGGRGPEIGSQPLSRNGVRIIDLTRKVLSQSGGWLTLYELIDLIREQSAVALARFINPGVAVSNALRVLRRRGEVELFQDEQSCKWRWIRDANSSVNTMPSFDP